jgi:hypothetical protein
MLFFLIFDKRFEKLSPLTHFYIKIRESFNTLTNNDFQKNNIKVKIIAKYSEHFLQSLVKNRSHIFSDLFLKINLLNIE